MGAPLCVGRLTISLSATRPRGSSMARLGTDTRTTASGDALKT
ncbi:hypothetical protein E2C01_012446 [Portunus trituberculatus]|uniref:Uncharacterized protein n=1 Tax=Portunus trituberculatus TaxID=210409 RepID=A0A5B7DDR9_PORTR|nr:hypothetical protein [Portunus trituberculatus]